MATLFTVFASQLVKNSTSSLAQGLTLDKKDVKNVSDFIRDNTKKHWKPLAALGVVGALAMGAYKLKQEIERQRQEESIAPTPSKVENLIESASLTEVGSSLERGMYGDLEILAEELIEELELEECIEVDPCFEEEDRNVDEDLLEKIHTCKSDIMKGELIKKQNLLNIRRCRKRVKQDKLPHACKAMVAKLRSSFPAPDGTAIQQKAMALYLAKIGRQLKIRSGQMSALIPKAVALASVPSDSQVDMRMLMAMEPVKFKYSQMKYKGGKGERSWLSGLAAVLSQ